MTKGLSRKRASFVASGTCMIAGCWMACVQKATPREVSATSSPTRDLNHWRCESMSVMSDIGVSQICDASSVRSSKRCSGSVSRIR
ncbi:MAG: hypothetical protein U0P30_16855 [Vicinamibacterales bacterium]